MVSPRLNIRQTEEAVSARLGDRQVDWPAMHAISSLYRAANAVRGRLTTDVLRPRDLSWTGFVVLWTIWIQEPIETRDVAESAAISKATLTGVAKTLEARGLIERAVSASDGRLVELRLTERGRTLMEELHPEFNAAESELIQGLSQYRVNEMTRGLRTLVETVESRDD